MYRDSDNWVVAYNMSLEQGWRYVKKFEPNLTFDKFKEDFWKSGDREFAFEEDYKYGVVSSQGCL